MAVDESSPPSKKTQQNQQFCRAEWEASATFMVFTNDVKKRADKSMGTLVAGRIISVSNDHIHLIYVFCWGKQAKAVFDKWPS